MAGYTINAISPGAAYWGPWNGPDTRCMCNTITWGLFSACGICQNRTAISCVALLSLCRGPDHSLFPDWRRWDMWTYNCSNVTNTRCEAMAIRETTSIHLAFHSGSLTKSIFHVGHVWTLGSVHSPFRSAQTVSEQFLRRQTVSGTKPRPGPTKVWTTPFIVFRNLA